VHTRSAPTVLQLRVHNPNLQIGVMIIKSLTSMREDDVVILNPAEAKRAAEQKQVIARVERLTSWAKGLGFTSLGLLVVIGSLWAYQSIVARNSTLTP
jgi:hypothetical protein